MPKLIQELGIEHFGTSAKYLSVLEQAGSTPREEGVPMDMLKSVFSTGSPLAPSTFQYVYDKFAPKGGVLLGSITGGTDIGTLSPDLTYSTVLFHTILTRLNNSLPLRRPLPTPPRPPRRDPMPRPGHGRAHLRQHGQGHHRHRPARRARLHRPLPLPARHVPARRARGAETLQGQLLRNVQCQRQASVAPRRFRALESPDGRDTHAGPQRRRAQPERRAVRE